MPAGRPQVADAGNLYVMAHTFYWELRRLAEGSVRWRFDEKKFQKLTQKLDNAQVIEDEDRARYQAIAEEEIRTGHLDADQKGSRIRAIEESETSARREHVRMTAGEQARTKIRVPGEKEVIDLLLDPATTPEQIREVCKEAFMTVTRRIGSEIREIHDYPAWPIPVGSTLPGYLSEHAEAYVAALGHPRFPRCEVSIRPSTRLKQLWFVSRALAGAVYGVKTRTAINLVGSLRPEEAFIESRGAKPRRRIRRKYKSRRTT